MVLGICLVLSVCSFVSFFQVAAVLGLGTGIPAVILGHQALRDMRNSNGTQGGKEMATAGLVLGSISIVVALIEGAITLLILFSLL